MKKLNILLFLAMMVVFVCCSESNDKGKSSVQNEILSDFKGIEDSDSILLDEFCLEATPEVYRSLVKYFDELNLQSSQGHDAFCISLSIEHEEVIDCRLEIVELSDALPLTVTKVTIETDLEKTLCRTLVGRKMCIDSFNNCKDGDYQFSIIIDKLLELTRRQR